MPLDLTLMSDGWCEQLEFIACHGGKFRPIRFASMFALIKHPQLGPIIFDTGYTSRFFDETRHFPAYVYRRITPVKLDKAGDVVMQLHRHGVRPEAVRHVVISHFHADHIGGLKDFPNAQFYCAEAAFNSIKNLRGWSALKHAFLPGLLPPDFQNRVIFIENLSRVRLPASHAPFVEAHDLFGDGSMLAVDLPGHAAGQIGVFLTSSTGSDYLLAADACWLSRQYRERLMPQAVVRLLIDWPAYKMTLQKLHELHRSNPTLQIIPTHCAEIWKDCS